jgi:hypothetical protein
MTIASKPGVQGSETGEGEQPFTPLPPPMTARFSKYGNLEQLELVGDDGMVVDRIISQRFTIKDEREGSK